MEARAIAPWKWVIGVVAAVGVAGYFVLGREAPKTPTRPVEKIAAEPGAQAAEPQARPRLRYDERKPVGGQVFPISNEQPGQPPMRPDLVVATQRAANIAAMMVNRPHGPNPAANLSVVSNPPATAGQPGNKAATGDGAAPAIENAPPHAPEAAEPNQRPAE